jgi:RsiW-degrading membrane proteinase PrsW (M82 family)
MSAYLSGSLAGSINSFFRGILSEATQARIEAPIVEELLKPLGLVLLAATLLRAEKKQRAKKRRPIRIDWLKSMKVDYAIGYASGFMFGVLENLLSYRTFSGLRSVTPFLHAFTTGVVGVGIYFILISGKGGIVKFIPLYFSAVFIHSAWNTIGSYTVHVVFGLSVITLGLGPLLLKLKREPAKSKSVRGIRSRTKALAM